MTPVRGERSNASTRRAITAGPPIISLIIRA
jgi:hypothetical protein